MEDEQPAGYGNPPKESRFKKGQSGNRRGRPKGLQTEIKVREGPRTIRISKQRAIVKTLIAKTLAGDARAATTLTNLMHRVLDLGDEAVNSEGLLTPDESETLEKFRERLLRSSNVIRAEDSPVPGRQSRPQEPADLAGDCKAETRTVSKRMNHEL